MPAQIQAALAGVGGGIAWADDSRWPFAEDATYETLADLRHRSGLSELEFRRQYFPDTGTIRVEVGLPEAGAGR